MQEKILIIDFGSQYTQLIARRVRETQVYCEIHPYNSIPDVSDYKGVILSGSPFSVHDEKAPQVDVSQFGETPLLAVCYGAQYLAHVTDGKVVPSEIREYGRAKLSFIDKANALCASLTIDSQVWMSHGDTIAEVPEKFKVILSTKDVSVAGYQVNGSHTYGIQFHPEVTHSHEGTQILKNFLLKI